MSINSISSIDSDETCNLCKKSNNIEIMMGNETDEIIENLIESLLQNYQNNLEESMRGSKFNFDNVDLLYYHLQKTSLKRGGWYIDSPDWPKNKKATTNSKNDHDNWFQYTLIAALNHKQIKSHTEYLILCLLLIGIIGKR